MLTIYLRANFDSAFYIGASHPYVNSAGTPIAYLNLGKDLTVYLSREQLLKVAEECTRAALEWPAPVAEDAGEVAGAAI